MCTSHKRFIVPLIAAAIALVSAKSPASVAGDLNGDGCVDGADFALLNAGWPGTSGLPELYALLANFGGCPPKIQFDYPLTPFPVPQVTSVEGATVELPIIATAPFSGTVYYTIRDQAPLAIGSEPVYAASIVTSGTSNEATLSVSLPSAIGHQIGANVVVAILGDDTGTVDYTPGLRSFVSIGMEDDEPLLSGLWAAQVTLTQRESLEGLQPLPTGITIPLFFYYDADANTVTEAKLPRLLPNVPYIRQVSNSSFGFGEDFNDYSPMPSVSDRTGFAMSGSLSGDTLSLLVTYEVDPVIWEWQRPNQTASTRTLSLDFVLPASNEDRLTAPILATNVHEETLLFDQNGRSSRIVLEGTGVMQYHAPATIPDLSPMPESPGSREVGPRMPSARFLQSQAKRDARAALATTLEIRPPSSDVNMVVADFSNRVRKPAATPTPAPPDAYTGGGEFLGSGGAVTSSGGLIAFGQPVAGNIRYEGAAAFLRNEAQVLRNGSTGFLSVNGVTKGDTPITQGIGETYTASSSLIFDGPNVRKGEELYVRSIGINPFDAAALGGLIESRTRCAVWYNLLADRAALKAWNVKYEFPSLAGITTLEREQDEFEVVAGHALTAARQLFTLFDDRQRLGVGEVMRLEHPLCSNAGIEDTRQAALEVAADSMRRWSEAERRIIHLDLLKDFFDEDSRNAALDASIQAQIVLEEAIRLLAAYSVPEEVPGAPVGSDVRYFSNASIGLLEGELGSMRRIEQDIRQGLNAFGFVPDFVPFLVTVNQQSETDNVVRARQLAAGLLSLTQVYESQAEQNLNQFVNSATQYDNRINELKTSYDERLRALCGVLEIQRVGGGAPPAGVQRFFPDVLTYAMPPGSETSNTLTLDRDELLEGGSFPVAGVGCKLVRRSYGQIWQQYLNIENAEDRIAQANVDLENNFAQMQIIEDTANQIAGVQERLVARVVKDGEAIVLLTKELGRLRKEAILASARAQKKAKKKSGLFGAISGIVSGVASGFGASSATVQAFGLAFGPAPAIAGLINGALSLAGNRAEIKALMAVANIEAGLAEAEANISAQIQEIQYLQQAEIIFSERDIGLLRAEEQLKTLALQQARLSLAIRIAERDYLRELSVLDGMMAEVDSLLADEARHQQLAAQTGALLPGYDRPDYRHAFKASQADAEAAFERTQAATFMAVRALEYYLNESQSIGQIYERLHSARRTTHLEAVLTDIDQALALNPVIIASDCPIESVLSLKYNIISSGDVVVTGETPGGTTVLAGNAFSYFDSVTQLELTGEAAYQARLRDFLRKALVTVPGTTKLRLQFPFATDVFQRQPPSNDFLPGTPIDYALAQNPLFNSANTRSQTIIGFTPQQCQTQTGQTFHGLTVNYVGVGIPTTQRLVLTLAQVGNQYLRSGRQDIGFDVENQLAAMNVYSSYTQKFPRTLRLSGTGESSYEILPGSRQADFSPRVNGVLPAGATGRTLVFTDRSIACDKWVLTMDEATQGQGTPQFLHQLDAALNASLSAANPVPFTYVTDIQFRLGWVPKFAQ